MKQVKRCERSECCMDCRLHVGLLFFLHSVYDSSQRTDSRIESGRSAAGECIHHQLLFLCDGPQYASVHGENENISVDKIHLAVDFYKKLIRNYP